MTKFDTFAPVCFKLFKTVSSDLTAFIFIIIINAIIVAF